MVVMGVVASCGCCYGGFCQLIVGVMVMAFVAGCCLVGVVVMGFVTRCRCGGDGFCVQLWV